MGYTNDQMSRIIDGYGTGHVEKKELGKEFYWDGDKVNIPASAWFIDTNENEIRFEPTTLHPFFTRGGEGTINSVNVSATGKYMAATDVQQTSLGWPGNVWLSSDYGNTWNKSPEASMQDTKYGKVAMSSDGSHLVALRNETLKPWLSNDYGLTWSLAPDVIASRFNFATISADGQYQVATSSNLDSWISSDYGASWAIIPEVTAIWHGKQTIMSDDGSKIVIVIDGTDSYIHSTDNGVSWSAQLTPTEFEGSNISDVIDMTPDGSRLYFLLVSGKIVYTEDHITWTEIININNLNPILGFSIPNSNEIWATSGEDFYYSKDAGITWKNISYLGSTEKLNFNYKVIAVSGDGKYILSGNWHQDNDGLIIANYGGKGLEVRTKLEIPNWATDTLSTPATVATKGWTEAKHLNIDFPATDASGNNGDSFLLDSSVYMKLEDTWRMLGTTNVF